MRVAVASDGIMVSGHFGHCKGFCLYDVEEKEIKKKVFVENPGHKPGYLPIFLKEQQVDSIIAGGMGEAAQILFSDNGIEVFVGAQGNTDDVIKKYMAGELESTGSVCKEHAYEGHCND